MSKKHHLSQEKYSDAGVIGIVSQLPDYRIVHFLNKEVDFTLVRSADLMVPQEAEKEPAGHPFFHAYNEEYGVTFCFIGNKSQYLPLIPMMRNIDYILLIINKGERYDIGGMIKKMRTLPGLLMVQEVDPGKLPGIDEVFHLIEIHLNALKDNNQLP